MTFAVPKPVRYINDAKRRWIATLPCLLAETGTCDGFVRAVTRRIVVECAHVRGKGAGGGDEQVIPLCGKHHRWGKHSLHNLNVAGFDRHWHTAVRRTARARHREWLVVERAA